MPKFLIKVSYTAEGVRGIMKEGGSSRRALVKKLISGVGGKMECFYFAYGESDAYVIADFKDTASALSLTMAVNASGAVRTSTVPLIEPEEVDAATKKSVKYRAPGA